MIVKSKWLPLVLKLSYFTYFFGVGCVQTFYSVILKTAGLDNSQIGTVQGVGMCGGIVGPILIGILADKTKKSRLILTICVVCSIIMHGGPIMIISFTTLAGFGSKSASSSIEGLGVPMKSSAPPKLVAVLTLLQLFATLFDQGTKSQLDGMVYKIIDMMKQDGKEIDYGKQRMFCPIGMGLASLTSGILLDNIKKVITLPFKEDILLALVCIVSGSACVVILTLFMPSAESRSSPMIFKEIAGLFRNTSVVMVLLLFLINQFGFNIIRHYEALYVITLGGSKLITGMCAAVHRVGEILMMYFSSTIIAAFGSEKVCIALCQIFFSLTVFTYSFADTPWISFNYSFLMGFSSGIQWPCISRVVKAGAPNHLISSYISILITFGKIGAAIANKVGGALSHIFGYRVIYMISAGTYCVSGVAYMFYIFITSLPRRRRKVDEYEEKEEHIIMEED